MQQLNLPAFNLKIKVSEGKTVIFDPLRKKYVVLTPEEWVRQHFVNYLIGHLGYPKSLIRVEQGMKYNRLLKRSDIVVHDRQGAPLLLVECKAPACHLGQKVMEQAMMYNKTLQASYIIVSNGLEHSCLYINRHTQQVKFLRALPRFADIVA